MEVRASLQKVSGSSDSVGTLNSEEFVLVPQHADDTSTKDEEKPQLKVFLTFLHMLVSNSWPQVILLSWLPNVLGLQA
uniref:Uncharacterized protein n=1 Tax=Prolemur simus TaxID=1328070 RepID=A0A8C9DET6_PROSS